MVQEGGTLPAQVLQQQGVPVVRGEELLPVPQRPRHDLGRAVVGANKKKKMGRRQ